jgi:DNA/RNA-binding domain of Phe-tRNA-synthetase-like protein
MIGSIAAPAHRHFRAAARGLAILVQREAMARWQGGVVDFQHSSEIWRDFPELVAGVVSADGITPDVSAGDRVAEYTAIASGRLAAATESERPEIRAWRRAFARMGLKPTQYRCASEALLRRLRKEGALPQVHPLVDVCNAVSAAFAIPVAVFDLARVTGHLHVRYAAGDEDYLTFSGQTEHPDPGEVIFADQAGQVHARRWTNRQSGRSAVSDPTAAVLIVAEAMHDSASNDVPELIAAVAGELKAVWSATPVTAMLSQSAPRFRFGN